MVTIGYLAGGTRFTREIFASAPDQILVMRLLAAVLDESRQLPLSAAADGVVAVLLPAGRRYEVRFA